MLRGKTAGLKKKSLVCEITATRCSRCLLFNLKKRNRVSRDRRKDCVLDELFKLSLILEHNVFVYQIKNIYISDSHFQLQVCSSSQPLSLCC